MNTKGNAAKAAQMMGREPINPLGSCFDTAGFIFIQANDGTEPTENERIVHGIGVANQPGQEGNPIAHAWIEFDHPTRGRVVFDPIWGVHTAAEAYRKNQQVSYCVEYTLNEFFELWKKYDMPGPYDADILALTTDGKKKAKQCKSI
jgi:hypothetical protein